MKLLRNKHGKTDHSFSFKYLKWLLWFSLSFYFFATSLHTHRPKTTSFNSLIYHHQPKPFKKINLKLYIYELPSKYNTDWLSNGRCNHHLFASEVLLHKTLSNSQVRTFDPSLADLFFVPVYVTCNFSTANGFPSIGHARGLLSSAVDFISSELPFWNRSNGSDHVFVASHDHGACFHTMVKKRKKHTHYVFTSLALVFVIVNNSL